MKKAILILRCKELDGSINTEVYALSPESTLQNLEDFIVHRNCSLVGDFIIKFWNVDEDS